MWDLTPTLDHDPLFVATALVFATLGSALVVTLYGKALDNGGTQRTIWGVIAGIVAGSTIWTTHYIALLGFFTSINRHYYLSTTLGSLVIATMFCVVGLVLASSSTRKWTVEAGGALVGTGIIASHVLSIQALNVIVEKDYEWGRLSCGVLVGILAGVAVTNRRARPLTRFCKYGAVAAMVAGIAVVHYIGVSGLHITPPYGDDWRSDIGLSERYVFLLTLFFGSLTLILGASANSIDSRNAAAQVKQLRHQAFHDTLTGLANRSLLIEKLTECLAPSFSKVAVVSFDLNRLKSINDVYGHDAGDFVLKGIAARLKQILRPDEVLCRVGGDEFVAFKTGIAGHVEAAAFSNRLRDAVIAVIELDGHKLSVGSSIGISLYPDHGGDPNELMVKADLAMYRAKRNAEASALFYDPEIDERNRQRSAISIELRGAMERNQFELYYQRQNRISDGKLVGYEVLLRWYLPSRGYVGPDVFIPIAERDGFINEIGEWVLRRACMEAASWINPMKIAVNVAARQLADDHLPGIVRSALADSGLDASLLEIEITESGIIADEAHALGIIQELKEIGVSIAMDDFGTGYSSLSTLQSFPFDKIKIDKAFIKGVSNNPQSMAIVRSTIMLGKNLGIAVLAEGVESQADLVFLRNEGITLVQGYLYGQPLPSNVLTSQSAFAAGI
jgi:diguanylate cyclase (GGDEF)-like protein